MEPRGGRVLAVALSTIAWASLSRCAMAAEVETDGGDAESVERVAEKDRGRAVLACKYAMWKKWSNGMEEIGALVNTTMDASRPADNIDGEPTMNYSEATRTLAYRQLASCIREITAADLDAHKSNTLSDSAAERLLGGPALGSNLSAEDRKAYDQALKGERVDGVAPSIMGVQVHRVPWWMQILYMLLVVAALCWVIKIAVERLTSREREEKARKEAKKKV